LGELKKPVDPAESRSVSLKMGDDMGQSGDDMVSYFLSATNHCQEG
jgi:hypothetical protein